MDQRTCPVCGSFFTPSVVNQKFCSPTPADRAAGRALSRCSRRSGNRAQRLREGRDVAPLDAPVVAVFDCAQCARVCIPGEGGVAYHATKFCGYSCKAQWHREREVNRVRAKKCAQQRLVSLRAKREIDRLMEWPPVLTRSDEVTYRRALRSDPCAYCGEPSQASDHIVPRSDGGPDDWTNRAGACHRCNNMKQSTPLLIFLAYKTTRNAFEPWRQIVAALHTR